MLGTVHIGAYNNTSGVYGDDRGIFMEYARSPVGDPALVLHELTHDWIRGRAALRAGAAADDDSPAWYVEGMASLAPIAVASAGLLPLSAEEQATMRQHWGQWAVPRTSADVAIQHDTRPQGGISIFYGKSYRAQLIVEHELGAEGYRALVHRTAEHLPQTNDDAIALLHEQKAELDWHGLLSGWVFEGAYGKYAPADIPKLMPPPTAAK